MSRKFVDPVVRSGAVDALNLPQGKLDDLEIPTTGGLDGVRDSVIEPVTDMHGFSDKAAALAFNEEILTVVISESAEENPEHFVYLSVNGRGAMKHGIPWVPRGVPVQIARKYVEQLCRAKPVQIRTVEGHDSDGAKTMRVKRSSALRYPFSVLNDPNPRGAQWLRDLLAQPQ